MTISYITEDPIGPPADPPTRSDPDNFRERADEFVDWQANDFPDEINGFITELNTFVDEVNETSDTINTNTAIGLDAKNVSLAAANFKGSWEDLTGSLSIPSSVEHGGEFWMLLTNLVDVTLSEPSVSNTDWAKITVPSKGTQYFTSNGTFTVPANVTQIEVKVWGAGGGAANYGTSGSGSGAGAGGGGGYCEKLISVSSGDIILVTVGTGGAGGSAGSTPDDGTTGGTSLFGAYCSATGGGGGSAASGTYTGIGGQGIGGDINLTGTDGGWSLLGAAGGSSFCSAGAPVIPNGSCKDGTFPGAGGASVIDSAIGGGNGADGLIIVKW